MDARTVSLPDDDPIVSVRPLSNSDHLRGSLDAPVHIVLFSDPECPYCKEWHQKILPRIESEFGAAIVIGYRHRLVARYTRSEREAEAMECAAILNGHDSFWKYTDAIFRETSSDDTLDPSLLSAIALDIGLSESEFARCLEKGSGRAKIAADRTEAATAELSVSPSVIMLTNHSLPIVIPGANYQAVRSAIDFLVRTYPQRSRE